MKKQLYRAAAATVLGLSLTTGVVAADTGSIDTTGPNSDNRISTRVNNRTHVNNDNDINVHNDNDQRAYSGDATVWGNTRGGDAETGDARNSNSTKVDVDIDNSSSLHNIDPGSGWSGVGGGGSISYTGPNSDNTISTRVNNSVKIDNENDVNISNDNDQKAVSGDARVSGNTKGGDAESGDATNTNSTSFSISIEN